MKLGTNIYNTNIILIYIPYMLYNYGYIKNIIERDLHYTLFDMFCISNRILQ